MLRITTSYARRPGTMCGQRGFVKRSVTQALADVTGRGWAKRRRTRGELDSEMAERLASREEDDSEAEHQFEDGDT